MTDEPDRTQPMPQRRVQPRPDTDDTQAYPAAPGPSGSASYGDPTASAYSGSDYHGSDYYGSGDGRSDAGGAGSTGSTGYARPGSQQAGYGSPDEQRLGYQQAGYQQHQQHQQHGDQHGYPPPGGYAQPEQRWDGGYGPPPAGYPGPGSYAPPQGGDGRRGRVPGRAGAIWALILGIVALVLVVLPLVPVLLGIFACVLAIIALSRSRRAAGAGAARGMAIGGLVTGVIAVLLGTVVGIGYWVAWQVVEPHLGELGQCVRLADQTEREQCINGVLDDVANEQGYPVEIGAVRSAEV